MDLTGKKVTHKTFGEGRIISHKGNTFEVVFDEGDERVFSLKGFKEFLTLQLPADQMAVLDYLENEERIKRDEESLNMSIRPVITNIRNDKKAEEEKKRTRIKTILYSEEGSSFLRVNPYMPGLDEKILALIGARDDFFEIYSQVQDVYLPQIEQYMTERLNKMPESFSIIDIQRINAPQISKICTPVIEKYSYLYLDPPERIQLIESDFDSMNLLTIALSETSEDYEYGFESFAVFLHEIEKVIYNNSQISKRKDISAGNMKTHYIDYVEQFINIELQSGRDTVYTDKQLCIFNRLLSTSCYQNHHTTVPAVYVAERREGDGFLRVPVHYCSVCDKYYIGKRTLAIFENQYGEIIAEKVTVDTDPGTFINYKLETKLHQLGYTVQEGEMSEAERRHLLIRIMQTKRMSYNDICSIIEWNIQRFESNPKFYKAVSKWENDLWYIGDYVLKHKEL